MGVAAVYSGNSQKPTQSRASEFVPVVESKNSEIISPDGKMTLSVNMRKINSENIYTFTIGDNQIYSNTLPPGLSMAIPFNTFSPDNKYFFLEETSLDKANYLVFTTNGKPFSGGDKSLEISSPFYQKYPNFKITDVTGWASPTLIVINTDKENGEQGPSFWFDVSTRSFYRLSTRFN